MTDRRWSDQPVFVLRGEVLATFRLDRDYEKTKLLVEVRRYPDGKFSLTAGNLFGSETIECTDTRAVFAAIDGIAHGRNELPRGCELATAAKEPDNNEPDYERE